MYLDHFFYFTNQIKPNCNIMKTLIKHMSPNPILSLPIGANQRRKYMWHLGIEIVKSTLLSRKNKKLFIGGHAFIIK